MESTLVYAANGEPRKLGRLLGEGGQGAVYRVHGAENICIKIFKRETLQNNRLSLQSRISAQIDLAGIFADTKVSWPRIHVFDSQKLWVGYAMRKADGHELRRLAHPMIYNKYFPSINRENIVTMLLSLVDTMEILHRNNVIVGDLNLGNVICDKDYGAHLIDADSFQFVSRGQIFTCPVAALVMTAPEYHVASLSSVSRTIESDLFCLAVLIFQVLMLGQHPYSAVGGEDPVDNIKKGHFAYAFKRGEAGESGNIPPGPWWKIWSHLSYKMKTNFIKTFRDGIHSPLDRATLVEWRAALLAYQNDLRKNYLDKAIKPDKPKMRKPVSEGNASI